MSEVDDVIGWLRVEYPDCIVQEVGIEKIEVGPTEPSREEIETPDGWTVTEYGREVDGYPARFQVERE